MRLFRLGLRNYSTGQPPAGGGARTGRDALAELFNFSGKTPSNNRPRGNQSHRSPNMASMAQLSAVSPPPRTGVYAGRSVPVLKQEDLPRAVAQLTRFNRINKVREVKNLQRFHEQPGKAKWRIRMARKRRDFRAGMKTLFHLALQAEKRGL